MKMVTVNFVDGRSIQAPARGKVLDRDYKLKPEAVETLFKCNLENIKKPKHVSTVDFVAIKAQEDENRAYYASMFAYYNYDRNGKVVNQYKSREEFYASFNKRRKRSK